MVALSLRISIGNVVKTMQFEPSTMVYDACRMIRERIPEALAGPPSDFGLFLSDDDPKKVSGSRLGKLWTTTCSEMGTPWSTEKNRDP